MTVQITRYNDNRPAPSDVVLERERAPQGWRTKIESNDALPFFWYLDPTATSDIGGYGVASPDPSLNVETILTAGYGGTGDTLIKAFATPPGVPGVAEVPVGVSLRSITATTPATNQVARFLFETYACDTDGSNEVLIRSAYTDVFSNDNAPAELISSVVLISAVPLLVTQRLVFKIYGARVSGGGGTVNISAYFNGSDHSAWIQSTILRS